MQETNHKAPPGQYLTFQLKSEHYAVPIGTVREINQYGEVTPVPRTPEFVRGVMNLRGKIIPVVDLRVKFGMDKFTLTRDTCIIVIETNIGQVGMIVDSVKEVVDLVEAQIEPAPQMGAVRQLEFVKGMGKIENRVLIIVDVVSAFSADQMGALGSVNQSQAA